jgi:hypothetical protein
VVKPSHRTAPTAGRYRNLGVWVVAGLALAATAATLSPSGSGPGVTCDEGYHVSMGKRLVTALRHQGPAFFAPANLRRHFPWQPDGPPAHPPLGNLILGAVHQLFDPAPNDPTQVSIHAARLAPALWLAVLVVLVGLWTVRRDGPLAGTLAAASVVLVPRVFGHAHLAALDLLTAAFLVAAVWAVSEALRSSRPARAMALAGVVWGLALLVRIHGLLLIPPVVVASCLVFRFRAWKPLACWLATGIAVFFVGWPWLWLDPLGNLGQYLSTATGRQPINVFYLGRVWLDHQAPWHYPWVMFLAVVPVGLLALGAVGTWAKGRRWRDEPDGLWVPGLIVWLLAVFSWPGVPVYDGVRLFLTVFPLWAILVGAGSAEIAARLRRWLGIRGMLGVPGRATRSGEAEARPSRAGEASRKARGNHKPRLEKPGKRQQAAARRVLAPDMAPGFGLPEVLVSAAVVLQGLVLVHYHPYPLCHYNLLFGGLGGAEQVGLEVDYWGASIREPLLDLAAKSDRPIFLVPSLAPFQAPAIQLSSPSLLAAFERNPSVRLIGWSPEPHGAVAAEYAVIYHRRADLSAAEALLQRAEPVVESRFGGVWLTKVVRLPAPESVD